jgi:Fn3 associated
MRNRHLGIALFVFSVLAGCGGSPKQTCATCGKSSGPDLGSSASPDASPKPAICDALAGLTVTATASSSIQLSWTGVAGVTYKISRKTYCGTDAYADLQTLPVGTTTYSDTTVNGNYVYWYLLTATANGDAASAAVAAQAASTSTLGCSGSASPQPSGASAACTMDAPDGGEAPMDLGSGANPDAGVLTGPIVNVNSAMSQSAIQSAISGAVSGSNIVFAAGNYSTTSSLTIPCTDLVISGPEVFPNTAKITTSAPAQNIFTMAGNCTAHRTIQYLGLYGAGPLYVGSGANANISFLHNTTGSLPSNAADDYATASLYFEGSGLPVSTSVSNVTIEYNQLGDDNSCTARYIPGTPATSDSDSCAGVIFGPSLLTNVVIKYNKFYHLIEGLHVRQADYEASNNGIKVGATDGLDIEYNYFLGIHRIAVEVQSGVVNHAFVLSNNIAQDYYAAYFGTLSFSTPCCQDTNIQGTLTNVNPAMVQKNNVQIQSIAGQPPYAVEFWGTGSQGLNALIQGGFGNGYTWGYGAGTWAVEDNIICGAAMAAGDSYVSNEEHQTNTPTQSGNVVSADCSAITSVAPMISVAGTTVTLADAGLTSGAGPLGNTSVYYTTDDSNPVPGSGTTKLYAGPFTVSGAGTVKAVGLYGAGGTNPQTWPTVYPAGFGYVPSAIVSKAY